MDGLLYSQDDVDASSNLVLLHWHEREGPPMEYSDDSATSLAHQSNVMEIFDVTPVRGSDSEDSDDGLGEFQCEGFRFNLYTDNRTVIIMYTAYLIMKQASPRMTPHIVFQLGLHPGLDVIFKLIDYGPVKGIHFENYVAWSRIIDSDVSYDNDGEKTNYYFSMLTQEGKTDEEILHEAWRGPGNMWVFVRPDRFVFVTFKNTSTHQPTLRDALQLPYCRDIGSETVVGNFGIRPASGRCRDDNARRSPS